MRFRSAASGGALIAALAAGLAGCASDGIIIHRMPPDTPAADHAAAMQKIEALAASEKAAKDEQHGDDRALPPLTAADAPPLKTYDPWERLNRFTYRFNARFDEAVFLPVSNGYRRAPSPIRSGVHNFFGNLSEVDSVVNYTLQGRLGRGVRSLGRFAINTTIGFGGLFDFASKFGIEKAPTGFGTTLSKWGMHPGPFFVIPILGPSTLREAVGLLGDYGTSYGINVANLYRGNQSWGLGVLNAVDQRANISFRYYSTGSPFEYEMIRFLYVRKLLLEDEGLHKKDSRKQRSPELPAGQ
ncbi:MAG: VacJ family lipoprotein [Gammaproteobacteria bacterium]|nr:VacJ family lipoprotein [Gammaproteobacteria bacterium]